MPGTLILSGGFLEDPASITGRQSYEFIADFSVGFAAPVHAKGRPIKLGRLLFWVAGFARALPAGWKG